MYRGKFKVLAKLAYLATAASTSSAREQQRDTSENRRSIISLSAATSEDFALRGVVTNWCLMTIEPEIIAFLCLAARLALAPEKNKPTEALLARHFTTAMMVVFAAFHVGMAVN